MATPHAGRTTAAIEGEFVVFVIGMRINRPWKITKWLPVFLAMPRMLRELATSPDSGFLGYTSGPIPTVMIQYWRSFDALEAYARAHDREHWPAWVAFNKRVGAASGDVGIWHETYRIAPGNWETIYAGMPPIGLGAASSLVPLRGGRDRSRGRLRGDLDADAVTPAEESAAPTA
jgi:hypothetical protein